jgi:DNA-binding CsgD family transcriptional regulator/PAS domain-containing protein
MPDLDLLLRTIEAAYAAGLDEALWPRFLSVATQLCGGAGATLEVFDKTTQSHLAFHAVGVPAKMEKSYLDYWAARSPRVQHGQRLKAGEVDCDYQFLDERGMDRDAFYSELLPLTDFRYFVSGTLANSNAAYSVFAIQRSRKQGHVGNAEIANMRLLIPHVRLALDVAKRLKQAGRATDALEHALDWLHDGAALVRGDGHIIHANASFAQIAARDDGIKIVRGSLAFRSSHAQTRFTGILAKIGRLQAGQAGTSATMDFLAPRASDQPSYVVAVRPLPAQVRSARERESIAIVFVRDPVARHAAAPDFLRDLFGFTPAEAALAQALQAGVSPAQYARDHGLSPNTVYTHLRRVKDKTGWNRTAELIRRLNEIRVPSRPR